MGRGNGVRVEFALSGAFKWDEESGTGALLYPRSLFALEEDVGGGSGLSFPSFPSLLSFDVLGGGGKGAGANAIGETDASEVSEGAGEGREYCLCTSLGFVKSGGPGGRPAFDICADPVGSGSVHCGRFAFCLLRLHSRLLLAGLPS